MPTVELEMDYLSFTLQRHPLAPLRRLRVIEQGDQVVITGTLPSYYYKQLAQEALMPLLGGRRLVNKVEVVSQG